ncbi:MAG: hypothetical protein AB1531_00140 [Chloroflexota bacterium]
MKSFLKSLGEHLPFYLVAISLTLIVSALYLTGTASGGDWAWRGVPLDDTWIHLVYARSLAEQGGFFYNPGIPEAGMSSPFWVALLALAYKLVSPLGITPQWIAKGTTLFFALLVPMVTYHTALALGLKRGWAWVAGLAVILESNLAYGNVAGMEAPLASLLLLAAIWAVARQRPVLAGLSIGFLVVTRGEGVPLALVIGAVPVLQKYLGRKKFEFLNRGEISLGLKLFLPALLTGSLWAFYNLKVSGHILPNTYYVKHNFSLGWFNPDNIFNLWTGYFRYLSLFERGLWILCLAAIGVAVYHAIRVRRWDILAWVALVPFLHIYLFSNNIKVAADGVLWTYFTRRYLDVILPILVLLVAYGLNAAWEIVQASQKRLAFLVTPMVMLTGLALFIYNTAARNLQFITEYSWDTQNIETVDVAMARWVGENLPPETVIAATDAGALRYFAVPGQTIVDFIGLNCAACIGRPADELLNAFAPDYVIFFRQGLNNSWQYEELFGITAERVIILGGRELVAVRMLALPPWPPQQP